MLFTYALVSLVALTAVSTLATPLPQIADVNLMGPDDVSPEAPKLRPTKKQGTSTTKPVTLLPTTTTQAVQVTGNVDVSDIVKTVGDQVLQNTTQGNPPEKRADDALVASASTENEPGSHKTFQDILKDRLKKQQDGNKPEKREDPIVILPSTTATTEDEIQFTAINTATTGIPSTTSLPCRLNRFDIIPC